MSVPGGEELPVGPEGVDGVGAAAGAGDAAQLEAEQGRQAGEQQHQPPAHPAVLPRVGQSLRIPELWSVTRVKFFRLVDIKTTAFQHLALVCHSVS